jgi:membrane-associated protease RseP (regulator of RpoE activity)
MPPAGALAVAVGRSEVRELAVPVFVTGVGRDEYAIGAVNGALMPGMPVFNLAGEVFAIAVPGGQEVRAVPVRAAAERLLARASSGEPPASSFGLGVQEVTEGLTAAFGSGGVIVADVVPGGPVDRMGVRAGDVLLSVGGVAIDSTDAALRALAAVTLDVPIPLRLRRGAAAREVLATPAPAYEVAALARSNDTAAQLPEARRLFSAAVLEAATIPASARVVSVNGRTVTTRAQVERELRRSRRAVPVLLRHGRQQFFVAMEPTR